MSEQPLGQMIIGLGLDSTNFSRGMKGISQQVKTSMTEMKAQLNVMGQSGSELDKLKVKQTSLTSVIAAQNQKVSLAKENYEACKAAVEGNTEATQKQRDALIRAQNEYVKAIGELGTYENQMQQVSIRLTALESDLYKTGDAMTKFGHSITKVGDIAAKAGTAMTVGVTAPILALGTYAVKTTAEFDSAMSKVSAVSGATGEALDQLRTKAREMGEKTKFSAKEAADAMNYMAMAGWKTSDMLDGIEGIMNLAAASGENLATTSDIVTDALTGFGKTAAESGKLADIIAAASSNANTNVALMGETFKYCTPIAGALGFTMEDTAEAIGLMANSGIKGSMAGTAMRAMMNNLAGELKLTGDAFGEMTIDTQNQDDSMRGLNDILADCRGAFSQMTDAEKVANAEALVGKNAMSGFLAVMNAAPADIEKLHSAISESEGAAVNMAETMKDNLAEQMTILKSQTDELAISFGSILMPKIRDLVSGVQGAVDKFNKMDDGTKKMITNSALMAAAVGPAVLIVGKLTSGIGNVTAGIGKGLKKFAEFDAKLKVTTGLTAAQTVAVKAQAAAEGAKNLAIAAGNGTLAAQAAALNLSLAAKIKNTVATIAHTVAEKARNPVLGASTAVLTAQTIATGAQTAATGALAVATGVLKTAITLLLGPIGWIIAGVTLLVSGIIAAVKWFTRESEAAKKTKKEVEDLAEANNTLTDSLSTSQKSYEDNEKSIKAEAGAAKSLADKVTQLSKVEHKSAAQKKELQAYVEMLNESTEGLNLKYNEQTDALSMTTSEIYAQISAMEEQAKAQAAKERMTEILKEQMSVNEQLAQVQNKITEATGNTALKERERKYIVADLTEQETALNDQLTSLGDSYNYVTDIIVASASTEAQAVTENTQTILEAYGSVGNAYDDLGEKQQQAIDGILGAFETMSGSLSNLTEKIKLDSKTTWDEIQKNQQDTIEKTQEFSTLYAQLIKEGVSDSYLKAIGATGPESIPLLKEMIAQGTDTILKSQDEWQEAYGVIGDTLTESLQLDDTVSSSLKDYVLGKSGIYGTIQGAIASADLNSLGKSLTDGISKGIIDNTDNVSGATTDMADSATGAAADAWGIHSPSRVFAEMGKFLMQGLVSGLTDGEGEVYTKASQIAKKVTKTVKDALEIHSPSRIMRDEVGKNIALGIAEGITQNGNYAKKSAEEVAGAIVEAARRKLDNTKVYQVLTLADEAAYWDSVRKQVKKGTQARIDADKQYFQAKQSLDKKMLDAEKTYTSKTKKLYEDLSRNIQSLEDSYVDKLASKTKSIADSLNLFDQFNTTTNLTTTDLLNNLQSQVTGLQDWTDNLRTLERRGVSKGLMDELRGMGTSAAGEIALLNQMTDEELDEYVSMWKQKQRLAKKEAKKELAPMLEETQEQISQMRMAASKELEGYKNDFLQAMNEIGVEIQKPLDQVQNSMVQVISQAVKTVAGTVSTEADSQANVSQFSQIAVSLKQTLSNLPADFVEIGQNTIGGLIQGLQNKSGELYQTMTEIVQSSVQAAKDAAQIHSPSRVMRSLGSFMIQGFGMGMEDNQGYVERVAEKSASQITKSFHGSIGNLSAAATGLSDRMGVIAAIEAAIRMLAGEKTEPTGNSLQSKSKDLLEQLVVSNQRMTKLLQAIADKNPIIDKESITGVLNSGLGEKQGVKVRVL